MQLPEPCLPFGVKSENAIGYHQVIYDKNTRFKILGLEYFEVAQKPERYEWAEITNLPESAYWWIGDMWGGKHILLVWSFTQHNVFTGAKRDIVNVTNCPPERMKGKGFTQYPIETSAQSIGDVGA